MKSLLHLHSIVTNDAGMHAGVVRTLNSVDVELIVCRIRRKKDFFKTY